MFEALSDRLQRVFRGLASKGRLSEQDVDEALREVRLALLEADVSFRVVRDFLGRVRERAVGAEVRESLTPAQQVVRIVNEELTDVLGKEPGRLDLGGPAPPIVVLVGLQGSGKTTTAAKLALHLRRQGQRPLLVAADVYRPAAVTQLMTLGKQIDVPVYEEGTASRPVDISARAVERARKDGHTVAIFDTAGRLQIDEQMMQELEEMRGRTRPREVLLVANAMTGQEAVRVAEQFKERAGITGLILTQIDGDARGGAALSIRAVTGVPIKFLGTGEQVDKLEIYHPDRLASRILGMGDVMTLIERTQEVFDQEQAALMEKKLRTATFDLEDFLNQLQQIKKMGSIGQILEMIPGFSQVARRPDVGAAVDDGQLKRVEAIIRSMTKEERAHPDIIDGSRRRRIARGSGTSASHVNALLNQFRQMREMMKQLSRGKLPRNLTGMWR